MCVLGHSIAPRRLVSSHTSQAHCLLLRVVRVAMDACASRSVPPMAHAASERFYRRARCHPTFAFMCIDR